MPVHYNRFPERRKVALLVQTSSEWSRQVLRGVAEFATEQGGWDFFVEPRGFREQLQLPTWWAGHGAIVRLTSPDIGRSLRRRGLPAVNVSWLGKHSAKIPKVVSDEAACGRLAAEHFTERGFRHSAFVGQRPEYGYSSATEDAFRQEFLKRGETFDSFPHPVGTRATLKTFRSELTQWLRTLPKPVGVVVWNADFGREVTTACANGHLLVPDEVAVLCVEHDSLMSSLAPTPLSNIDQDGIGVGYSAAALLEQMMQGGAAPAEPIEVRPLRIVCRVSSDTLAADDLIVVQAIRFIRDHAHHPIQVIDVLNHVHVSRRILEHRFEGVVGRSPADEIRRVRLSRVKELLLSTKLSLEQITVRSGFNHLEVMVRCFRREFGITPGQFRSRVR